MRLKSTFIAMLMTDLLESHLQKSKDSQTKDSQSSSPCWGIARPCIRVKEYERRTIRFIMKHIMMCHAIIRTSNDFDRKSAASRKNRNVAFDTWEERKDLCIFSERRVISDQVLLKRAQAVSRVRSHHIRWSRFRRAWRRIRWASVENEWQL